MSGQKGVLYLVPTPIAEDTARQVIPLQSQLVLAELTLLIVENQKSARRFLKDLDLAREVSSYRMLELNEHTHSRALTELLEPLLQGTSVGLLSEAGAPCVADPGAELCRLAHQHGIAIKPLVGPSSLLLALMACGLNGQSFSFVGYLPIDPNERLQRIRALERTSQELKQTQIVMETPYRSEKLLETLISSCSPSTWLCVASKLTTPSELIITKRIESWRGQRPQLGKAPTLFLLLADG